MYDRPLMPGLRRRLALASARIGAWAAQRRFLGVVLRTYARVSTRLRRPVQVVGLAGLAAGGAWLGMFLGQTAAPVGPVDTTMRLVPSWDGESKVSLPPLGTLELDTHDGPVQIQVSVDAINPVAAKRLVEDPQALRGLEPEIVDDVRTGIYATATKGLITGTLGAMTVTLIVMRRRIPTLIAGGGAAVAILTVLSVAGATLDPRAVAEPKYTGLLASAPSLVGNAQDLAESFGAYSDELVRLVGSVSELYDVTNTLPATSASDDEIRVLHVSDLHLGEHAWDIIGSVTRQYSIDVIVDSGDITDHGLPAENYFLQPIRNLGVPYVWVRGNHDSLVTEEAMRALPNGVVLDGKVKTVKGIRFLGAGDPRFTPAWRRVVPESDTRAVANQAFALAKVAKNSFPAVDAIVFHDSAGATFFDGHASLLLTGHGHEHLTRVLPKGSRLMQEGTTGGAGMRALKYEEPQPVALSVLYLDRSTRELRAWDQITLGGLGLTSAQIQRHQVKPDEEAEPPPSPIPTPTGSVPETPVSSPTVSLDPSPPPSPSSPSPSSPSPSSPSLSSPQPDGR